MLGDIEPSEFLRDYWHKKPLLIRNAIPGFKGLLNPDELIELASLEDAQSRLVTFDKNRWSLENGPFEKRRFRKLPEYWTILVQGVNHFLPEGAKLLGQFDFIPHARLDDLMVSFAPDGGGVGPHFDSYDVFLLQGMGCRRWQISAQQDSELIPDAPLRILARFEPEQEWILEPGDMLYLPPKYAHNGVAIGNSMTYSIGFRAPSPGTGDPVPGSPAGSSRNGRDVRGPRSANTGASCGDRGCHAEKGFPHPGEDTLE